jgi:hypothetical protein
MCIFGLLWESGHHRALAMSPHFTLLQLQIISMGEFSVETIIEAPIETVWTRLAEDIGSIVDWNPGVEASHLTSNNKQGLGACRHCDLGGNN